MTIEKPKTLAEILAWLDAVDQGLVPEATAEDQAHVGALLTAKIDNTADVDRQLEWDEKRLRDAADQLLDGARKIAARRERISQYIAYHMQAKGFTQLPGELWRAKLNTGISAAPKSKKPAKADVENTPRFVRVKYEWDKTALKKALEALDPDAMKLATLVPSASVSIEAHTGKLLT